ncbi:MAG: hypothetical protein JW891_04685 [Candidatus Lokiarchaeota archaeon]|nr:hypothetical protein [Candidatus Lokiarchaeota archaeon]
MVPACQDLELVGLVIMIELGSGLILRHSPLVSGRRPCNMSTPRRESN